MLPPDFLSRVLAWTLLISAVVLGFVLLADQLPDIESNNMDMAPIAAQPASKSR